MIETTWKIVVYESTGENLYLNKVEAPTYEVSGFPTKEAAEKYCYDNLIGNGKQYGYVRCDRWKPDNMGLGK